MAALKNQRWETFAQSYVKEADATKAMIAAFPNRAKWKKAAQYSNAAALLAKSMIAERIKELQEELKAKSIISAEEILNLCARVIKGEQITDFQEGQAGKPIKERTIPKTWAIERVCRMLGFDKPTEVELTKKEPELSREEMIAEIERLQRTRGNGKDD